MIDIPHRAINANLQWAIACDLAVTAKQTADASALRAFAIDHANNLYLGELIHLRDETPQIVEELCNLADIYAHKNETPTIQLFMERGVITNAILPQLQSRLVERELAVTVQPVHMPGDKQAKARVLQARMQLGRVYHLAGTQFLNTVLAEYLGFGSGGKHDDIVDADAIAAYVIQEGIVPSPPEVREVAESVDEHNMTYEQMLSRRRLGRDNEARRHVPTMLNGSERKQKKGTPGYRWEDNEQEPDEKKTFYLRRSR